MKRSVTTTPVLANGSIAVDPKHCPTLHRSLSRGMDLSRDGWGKVVELREARQDDSADRLARKLLGCIEPMTEEAKEKLRAYAEAHKDEIVARRKEKRERRKKLLAVARAVVRPTKRRRVS